MATITGYVQRLTLLQDSLFACAWIGASPDVTELMTLGLGASDTEQQLRFKCALIDALSEAQIAGRQVDVVHADDASVIEQVSTTACTETVPIQVDAIEITQGIQDLAQSIPLLAGKRTVVRVYLSHPADPAPTVRGEISVRKGPDDVPFVVPSENVAVLTAAEAGNLPIKREDSARSLNFVLPDSTEGQLGIELTSITDSTTDADMAFTCERRPVVWFHASAPLRIRVVGFRYLQDGVAYVPTPLDFALLKSWLGRAYPSGLLIATTTLTDATAAVPFTCGDINAELAAIRTLDMDAGGDERTHYYGLVSDGGFFMRGCAGVPADPSPDAVGSGPTGPATWGWDTDGSYGDWYGGHELGHTYGRKHPGFCGETADDLDNYPFASGQLANLNTSFMGFDVGDPANGIVVKALPGTQWHDVMTYCNLQWLSPYTYLGIRRRLGDEDALGPDGVAGPGPEPGATVPALAGGGRPDQRFPHASRRRDIQAGTPEGMVSVTGTVNLTQRTGKIRHVNPLERPKWRRQGGDDARLRVRGPDGELLADIPIAVRFNSELAPGDDRTGIVDATVSIDARARAIELVIEGQVVDTYRVGGKLPDMRGLRGEGGRLAMTGATDLGETAVRYSVQVSTDAGRTWQTVATGIKSPSFDVDRSQFERGQEVRVRVIATNGIERSVVETQTFRN